MKLSLGPVLYNWDKDTVSSFYEEAIEMPVARVYIGQAICTQRKSFKAKEIEEIAHTLQEAGKEVIISTPALVSNEAELSFIKELLRLPFAIEANEMSALSLALKAKKEVYAGPHIECYNTEDAAFLEGLGVKGITVPMELNKESIEKIAAVSNIDIEFAAHGHLPLAFSWRCYTLRDQGLGKADCANQCGAHPEGLTIKASDNSGGFRINGTSVLSMEIYSLIEKAEELKQSKSSHIRIYPELKGTKDIADAFSDALKGKELDLTALGLGDTVSGYFDNEANKIKIDPTIKQRALA
ncbi:MAG: U32 family peptidase [Deltaproteobacteria bacterium]|nr:U32 family peptidase [Deltaproteobacteria bacterium]